MKICNSRKERFDIRIEKVRIWYHGTPNEYEDALELFKNGFRDNTSFTSDFHVAAFFATRKPSAPKKRYPVVIVVKAIPFELVKYIWGEKNKKIVNIKCYPLSFSYIKKFIILDNNNTKHYFVKKYRVIFFS